VPGLLLLLAESPRDAHTSEIHTTRSSTSEGGDGEKGVKGVLMRGNKEKQSSRRVHFILPNCKCSYFPACTSSALLRV